MYRARPNKPCLTLCSFHVYRAWRRQEETRSEEGKEESRRQEEINVEIMQTPPATMQCLIFLL
jgi:hypothetical protein